MRTVLDNLLGTTQRTLATEIGYSLLGNDNIHIVLGTIYMTAHRNDGRNATVLGGTLRSEDRDETITLVVAGTSDTIHQLAAADMAGKEYVEIDAHKIIGVVECCIPEEARAFKPLDPVTEQMGHNVADFLVSDLKKGRIPSQFLPLQSGVGVTSNAVLEALGQNPNVPVFSVYTEVVQDAVVKYMREGRIKDASCSSLTVTNETLKEVYDDIEYFKKHLTIRQSEISNSPEVIRRLGVIAMNTAIECDIYGNENSSHICGSKLMNGIGGSCDYERNGFISIFTTQSTTKNGCISAIVPMCSHVDSTEHDVDVIVTEQGVADLRGKGPLRRAKEIIENCAHPDYRPMLREYLKFAEKGHEPQSMRAALAMHDTFLKKGDMRLTDFGEYLK